MSRGTAEWEMTTHLEVIAERPVAQHLEKGVVVRVLAYILEIVVLSTGTDTLLRVEGALELGELGVGIDGAKEDGFVLGWW